MMTLLPSSIRLRRSARRLFGWRTLRKAQLTAMRALLRGRDALVVLPTGAGKSAVYQVPATLLSGPTIVISPQTHAGTRSAGRFTHYSLLRTTEEMLGLKTVGAAAKAPSMRAAFGL